MQTNIGELKGFPNDTRFANSCCLKNMQNQNYFQSLVSGRNQDQARLKIT